MWKPALAAVIMTAAFSVHAQVKIVDSKPMGAQEQRASASRAAAVPDVDRQVELYYQLQVLQQEVLELRGLMEEQAYELRRLKQQRLDDYLDLDRRLSQLAQPGQQAPPGAASALRPQPETVAPRTEDLPDPGPSPSDELASYRTAVDLVLNQRDFDGGLEAMKAYLDEFPRGHYAGNAQYWLGQIYLQQNELENSERWFSQLIRDFPSHQKTQEAKFKLGRVYHLMEDPERARNLLEEVANSGDAAAALAQDYLKQHF